MYIFGAGGHTKVIIEIIELLGLPIDGLFVDNLENRNLLDYPVKIYQDEPLNDVIIAIGDNLSRKNLAKRLETSYCSVIHPQSIISPRAVIGKGSVVMGGVTINSMSVIGQHCIINTNASIDHDCTINNFVHISPNVALCGNVTIGEGSHIGAGSVIIPGIKIGKWCTIGAGSVIIRDIADNARIAGNPGTIIRPASF